MNLSKNYNLLALAAISMLNVNCIASSSTKVATLSLGASWAQSKSVYQALNPENLRVFSDSSSNNAFLTGELFGGLQKEISPGWLGQLGVAVATTASAKMSGQIWLDANPTFNNFYYNYSINRTYVGIKGKLLKETNWNGVMPYVSASAGISFNRAHSYNSVPVNFEDVADAPFPDYVTQSFSYVLGAGIQKTINQRWSAGVGYEFSDWGTSGLGAIPGQTAPTAIPLNNLYNNAAIVYISYHA